MRRYGVPYIAEFVCYDCDVLLCVGLVYRILGNFFYCDFGVLLCVGMVYCILRGLGVLSVVCFCASVWFSV